MKIRERSGLRSMVKIIWLVTAVDRTVPPFLTVQ